MRSGLLKIRLKRVIHREEGASLIEVVLLLVILGIALVPLTQLTVNNAKNGAKYLIMTRASTFAQERMEEVIADYRAEDAGRGYAFVLANWAGQSDTPAAGFTRTVSISGEMILNGVTYVTVTVSVANTNIQTLSLPTIIVK